MDGEDKWMAKTDGRLRRKNSKWKGKHRKRPSKIETSKGRNVLRLHTAQTVFYTTTNKYLKTTQQEVELTTAKVRHSEGPP